MAYADRAGYARVDPQRPRAFGVCDGCGAWYNRNDLRVQYEYMGDSLGDTGQRYCRRCLSKPQPQLKPVLLPPDPVPISDPRPEVAVLLQNLNGFSQVVGPQGTTINNPVAAELDPTDPIEVASAVIASADTGWGMPRPSVRGWFGVIGTSGVGQLAVPANANRTYLLIYNPFGGMLWAAQGQSPVLGMPAANVLNTPPPVQNSSVLVGTGEALLQNGGASPPAPVWTGEIWVLGLIPGVPWWIWEGPAGAADLDFRTPANAVYLTTIAGFP